jgi:predicted dehydrogenase
MQSTIITLDKPGGRPMKKTNYYLPLIIREKLRGWQSTAVQTLVEEIADFMRLAQDETPNGPVASAEDGYRAIEIADAVYQSTKNNRMTALADRV